MNQAPPVVEVPGYRDLVAAKKRRQDGIGFDPTFLPDCLKDFQRIITAKAVQRGRYAIFADCGLGKTLMQLVWAHNVREHTSRPVVVLCPLAVADQTVREASKFGLANVHQITDADQVTDDGAIYVINYDRLDKIADIIERFAGVVLDESSILKNFSGKTKRRLLELFARTPYKLACTATPAPNDYIELGNHAEFLGVMPSNEMLMRWFINDTMNFGTWRLKGHAERDFWSWVASWAACLAKPSDIHGCSDEGYDLPPHEIINEIVDVDITSDADGTLFRVPDMSATGIHREMRRTLTERCARAAALVNAETDRPWIVWCNLNEESSELTRLISGAIEVKGSDKLEDKEARLRAFTTGDARVIVTKPSIAGHGMNWQHCNRAVYVGLTYSFEDFYQASRRTWRFGQVNPVRSYVISTVQDEKVMDTINRKMLDHQRMREAMSKVAHEIMDEDRDDKLKDSPAKQEASGRNWRLLNGDCVELVAAMDTDSIHYSVFSPPFASLYIYSDNARDMGNCADDAEFMASFLFLIRELYRVTKPGRLCSVHCKQLVDYKGRDGRAGMRDFRGDIIRAFESAGWKYHAEVCIWKDPVIEMQRTKAHGLLYKQLRADSSFSRQGMAEYLCTFRKWAGEEDVIEPVTHTPDSFALPDWQEIASPVWTTIQQTNVLNVKIARESQDEKHLCPLQLDVIERALRLWSNPGDMILSPFAGIGSEGYISLKMRRRFIGCELKEAYFKQAVRNLGEIEAEVDGQTNLFDIIGNEA